MSILVTGSLAIDRIMVFPDRFKNHILPDKLHILSVSFHVPTLDEFFGGCAGNIAYGIRRLGGEPVIVAAAGRDFGAYAQWLDRHGIRRDGIAVFDDAYTAQCFITTDLDDNQITAFHPGAMNHSWKIQVPANDGITIGVIAPDSREGMLQHAEQFKAANIPFIFDPGQAMPLFQGDDFRRFITIADWLAVNDYEWHLLQERTGWSVDDCTRHVKALIITKGADGSVIYVDGKEYRIPCAKAKAVVDPTGCGDAYRAGLIHGILNGLDWETTGRIASLMGAIKIAHAGPQQHSFTMTEFRQRFRAEFGGEL